jgi:hypothetical protein
MEEKKINTSSKETLIENKINYRGIPLIKVLGVLISFGTFIEYFNDNLFFAILTSLFFITITYLLMLFFEGYAALISFKRNETTK